jgi:hypothetical protein
MPFFGKFGVLHEGSVLGNMETVLDPLESTVRRLNGVLLVAFGLITAAAVA